MSLNIFLGYPKPIMKSQEDFIEKIRNYLRVRGLHPRTLGVTEYDMDAPLVSIRKLMSDSSGLITIAFRRTYIGRGIIKHNADIVGLTETMVNQTWFTTPWAHIEPAMAYQIGMPILILREQNVFEDGILEKGVVGLYMPEFNLERGVGEYFESREWKNIIEQWENRVRDFVKIKVKNV